MVIPEDPPQEHTFHRVVAVEPVALVTLDVLDLAALGQPGHLMQLVMPEVVVVEVAAGVALVGHQADQCHLVAALLEPAELIPVAVVVVAQMLQLAETVDQA